MITRIGISFGNSTNNNDKPNIREGKGASLLVAISDYTAIDLKTGGQCSCRILRQLHWPPVFIIYGSGFPAA